MSRREPWWLEGRNLVAAFIAVAVPTFATIFGAAVASWSPWLRFTLFAVFVAAALTIVVDGHRRAREIENSIRLGAGSAVQQRQRQRIAAMETAFRRIFNVGSIELRKKYTWTVFVYDEERNLLVPAWPTPDPAADTEKLFTLKSFAPGKGATGQAWISRATIVRYGDDVHNGVHGLTTEQQALYAEYNTVVATPIYDDDDDLIGVLAGITTEADTTYEQAGDRHTLEATASVVGTLLATLRDANTETE
jgi:hypothetical protein